jgi:uncharacterized membrane protein
MSDWYYAQDGVQKGPMNEAQLKEMIANKQLPGDTLVWREGFSEWSPANQLPAFSFRPPPIPAAQPRPAKPAAAPAAVAQPVQLVSHAITVESLTITQNPEEEEIMQGEPADVEKNKVFSILAYIGILFLVPLIAAKDSPFARYHTNQGLVLFLAWLVLSIGVYIVSMIFYIIPGLGYVLAQILNLAVLGAGLALMIMGIMAAAKGEMKPLPIIGNITILK